MGGVEAAVPSELSSSWLNCTNGPHTSARCPCTHTPLLGLTRTARKVLKTHSDYGRANPTQELFKKPTTHLQETLQRVDICFPFHLKNPKNVFQPSLCKNRTLYQPVSVPGVSLVEQVCLCCCRRVWVPMLAAD